MIALDTITTEAHTRKPRRPARHIPDRPASGFTIWTGERITSHRAEMDHLVEIRSNLTQMESLDEQMVVLENRANRLFQKLHDPDLVRDYDEEHPLRLDAEERLVSLMKGIQALTLQLINCANEIHTHGHYAIDDGDEDKVDEIGQTLRHDVGALGRVQEHAAGLLTGITWNRLYRASCPF